MDDSRQMTKPAPILDPGPPRLRIGFLLTPRFTLSAFANFVDVLRLAADEGDGSRPIRCRWRVLSADMAPVQSSCGARIEPDERLGDPARFDYIVTVGGLIDGGPGLSPEQAGFLRRAGQARVALGGLCTGVFAMARIGLMDGYRCCVSWFHHQDFLAEFERMRPSRTRSSWWTATGCPVRGASAPRIWPPFWSIATWAAPRRARRCRS